MIVSPLARCTGTAISVYIVSLDNPSATFQEIADGLGVSLRTVQRAVKELESKGVLTRVSRTTDYGVPMPSLLHDISVASQVRDRDKSVAPPSDEVEMSDLDRDRSVGVSVRYVVSSKPVSLRIGVLRTPHLSDAERPEDEVGYEFFEQPNADTAPRREKHTGPTPAQERSLEVKARRHEGRAMRPESDWTSMDVAQHWRDEAMRAYPMKAGTVGSTKTMAQIFAKRAFDLSETPEVQVEMIRRFLADPRLAARANRKLTMLALLLAFCNRNADDVRKYLSGAEDRAKVEELMQSDEALEAYYDKALAKMDAELGLV